jgi:hypothetical protein
VRMSGRTLTEGGADDAEDAGIETISMQDPFLSSSPMFFPFTPLRGDRVSHGYQHQKRSAAVEELDWGED